MFVRLWLGVCSATRSKSNSNDPVDFADECRSWHKRFYARHQRIEFSRQLHGQLEWRGEASDVCELYTAYDYRFRCRLERSWNRSGRSYQSGPCRWSGFHEFHHLSPVGPSGSICFSKHLGRGHSRNHLNGYRQQLCSEFCRGMEWFKPSDNLCQQYSTHGADSCFGSHDPCGKPSSNRHDPQSWRWQFKQCFCGNRKPRAADNHLS